MCMYDSGWGFVQGLFLADAGEFFQGAGEGKGDGAEGDVEDTGDLAVAEAFGAEEEALAIEVGEGVDDAADGGVLLLADGELFGVEAGFLEGELGDGGELEILPAEALEGEIASDAEDPAADVIVGLAGGEVLVEGEEGFLQDVFAVVDGEAEGGEVAEDGRAEIGVEGDDLFFEGVAGGGVCVAEPTGGAGPGDLCHG